MNEGLVVEKDEQDLPWKRVLTQYLQEAIEFFFPDVAQVVDWTIAPVFLDKEFGQIAPDAKRGRRYADQLVQLHRTQGDPIVLLLHIEIQASPEKEFAERMFVYAIRIFDYFRQPAVSVAILCDANPKWRPNHYSFSLPQTALNFEFGTVKLLDYNDRWAELEASQNPFAWVVMVQLKMLETKKDKPTRKIWKMRLARRLYESGYNQDEVLNLFRFLDWVLKLPKNLEAEFLQELTAYEEERRMPYVTSVERIGIEKGIEKGERSMTLQQLTYKFGELPDPIVTQINSLPAQRVKVLGRELLDFESIENLTRWLEASRESIN